MVHFCCVSTVREGVHECIEKELERREAVGKFGGLIKVLALYSNPCALGIQPGPAPTDLLVLPHSWASSSSYYTCGFEFGCNLLKPPGSCVSGQRFVSGTQAEAAKTEFVKREKHFLGKGNGLAS